MEDQPRKANADVTPEKRSRFSWPHLGRRSAIVLAILGGLIVLAAAGVAYAGYDYGQDYEGRIMPGSSIAGVDVEDMTPDEAMEAVRAAIEPQLNRVITVSWDDKDWTVTPKELGARNDADAAIAAAMQASSEASFFHKIRMSVFGDDLDFERDVAITYPRQGIRGFVRGLASSLDQEAVDAEIDYSSGWVEIRKEKEGRDVREAKSRRALMRALRTQDPTVKLSVKVEKPEVTSKDFDQILLLRIGENRLYLYDDGKITHEWDVATGQPEYMTPTGIWEVTELRYMPTWVNPDPEGWGADMPLTIGPGPSNPLGTRAINWSADAIRFHGTSADYSIGYNASHGCVRMHMWDVEELYELVEVGTPIVSTVVGELKPLYAAAPDPTPVADEGEATTESTEDTTTPSNENDGGQGKKKKNG